MIVPFWLAYIAARRGIHNLTAVAHTLCGGSGHNHNHHHHGAICTIVRVKNTEAILCSSRDEQFAAQDEHRTPVPDSDLDRMGMCLCREKTPNNNRDNRDSGNAPSSSPNVAAVDPSFREFYSQGRQWRLGVGEGRREQFTVHTSRSHNHNGRSLVTSGYTKKYGSQSGKSIDSLVLETLALIRTLVDK